MVSEKLDNDVNEYLKDSSYASRSEFIRTAIRNEMDKDNSGQKNITVQKPVFDVPELETQHIMVSEQKNTPIDIDAIKARILRE